jgi:hypothetical protein
MKKFKMILSRDYVIEIKAENEHTAVKYAQFYVGGDLDVSTRATRKKYNFKLKAIELITNDVYEVEEI